MIKRPPETRETSRLFAVLFTGFCCFLCLAPRFFPRGHQRFSLSGLALYHLFGPFGFPFIQAGFGLGHIRIRNCDGITTPSLIRLSVLRPCDEIVYANRIEIVRFTLHRLLATFAN